jgi:glycosyltransferase involved in cell wall biosynthesis
VQGHVQSEQTEIVVQSALETVRLLYVIGELHTGGSERQLCYCLRTINRERYRPAVAVWNYSDQDVHLPEVRALGVPVYSIAAGGSRLAKLAALRAVVHKLDPEVVHSWSFYTNFAAYCATRGHRAIPVGSIRSGFSWAVRECGPIIGRLSARWPANQICNSFSAAENARSSRSRFAPASLSVVPNGLDLNRYVATSAPSERPIRIVGIGYLLPVKRWDRLLHAVHVLKLKGTQCRVQLAGDGPLRSALEALAIDLDIADSVRFLGHVDDIPQLLASASFVVHTGDVEGYPNAVMEAMACGRAVVATNAGDISSLIDDGRTGFVVAGGDDGTLVERIATLITDMNRCRSMGEAARLKAERTFGLDRLVQGTLEVYRRCGWEDVPPKSTQ